MQIADEFCKGIAEGAINELNKSKFIEDAKQKSWWAHSPVTAKESDFSTFNPDRFKGQDGIRPDKIILDEMELPRANKGLPRYSDVMTKEEFYTIFKAKPPTTERFRCPYCKKELVTVEEIEEWE